MKFNFSNNIFNENYYKNINIINKNVKFSQRNKESETPNTFIRFPKKKSEILVNLQSENNSDYDINKNGSGLLEKDSNMFIDSSNKSLSNSTEDFFGNKNINNDSKNELSDNNKTIINNNNEIKKKNRKEKKVLGRINKKSNIIPINLSNDPKLMQDDKSKNSRNITEDNFKYKNNKNLLENLKLEDLNIQNLNFINHKQKRENKEVYEIQSPEFYLKNEDSEENFFNRKNDKETKEDIREWDDLVKMCNLSKKDFIFFSTKKYLRNLIDLIQCLKKLINDKNYQTKLLLEENENLNQKNNILHKENIILIQQNINIMKKTSNLNNDYNKSKINQDSLFSMVKFIFF